MPPLATDLRNRLERTVVQARDVAEAGAQAALEALAVHHHEPYPHQTPEQRRLRNQLRAHARQLGDQQDRRGKLCIDHLVHECAYEHWHRMLFARFLAENDLLIEPSSDVAISLHECEELAKEAGTDLWTYASRCAQKMLPRIFRPDDPVLQVAMTREHRIKLEQLLAALTPPVFKADDALGWVYQFWQSKKKDEVNKSGQKITGDTLPAVTQLFTEHYMVLFLLHNTIGAWHAGKVLATNPALAEGASSEDDLRKAVSLTAAGGYSFDYLRFVKVDAASSRVSHIGYFDRDEPIENLSGNLPHWRQEGVTYFVTFRTSDSLPHEKARQWQEEKNKWLAQHPEPHDESTRNEYYRRFPDRMQRWLDAGYGECQLAREECRTIVEDALRFFDGTRYHLDELVVMPNHVHVMLTPLGEHTLSDILHSWKSFTANKINALSQRPGPFWQKESFDHIVRSPRQLERIRQYIRDNPKKGKVETQQDAEPPETRQDPEPLETRQDAASTWRPAAGAFEGWPGRAAELKVLDPCCGSGHFLVAGFELLVRLRMHEEGLSLPDAVDAVLRENIHGLEIDPRCTQIAAFNLAFSAWKLAGFRRLPPLNIACTGLAPRASKQEWLEIAERAAREGGMPVLHKDLFETEESLLSDTIKTGLENLYDLFQQAPELGSLIDPRRVSGGLYTAEYRELEPLLELALEAESAGDAQHELAVAAHGMARAAALLGSTCNLVATNVPYLGHKKQEKPMKDYCEKAHPDAKSDLATCLVERCLALCAHAGTAAVVTPRNWLFLRGYRGLRHKLLTSAELNAVVPLGNGAFGTQMWDFNTILLIITQRNPSSDHMFAGIDVSEKKGLAEKTRALTTADSVLLRQLAQVANPDAVLTLSEASTVPLLRGFTGSFAGVQTGDYPRFGRCFWEVAHLDHVWAFQSSTVGETSLWQGREGILRWERGSGELHAFVAERLGEARVKSWLRGHECWGRMGVAISVMGRLAASCYTGELFDDNVAVLIPRRDEHLLPLLSFCSSPRFAQEVRRINQKVSLKTQYLLNVPFDLPHWRGIASQEYPNGLPEPESDDPTQWLFHGRPEHSTAPLQVAVARMLGYRWPPELDEEMRLSAPARALVKRCDELLKFADADGIVCVPSLRGEDRAADRLAAVLHACGIKPDRDLDEWLRNSFFEWHCKLFHHRPFIWHIWDGRKRDGFQALVNYHRLAEGEGKGRRLLESLTYSYLGDWISRQQDGVKRGEEGAEDRLVAAIELQKRLVAILEGEPPFDIFVRWKPLYQQPIGWDPDINDGVRLNIRPFVASDLPNGRTGAGVLRWKPNIKWDKDRGREPERKKTDFPWFWGWDGRTVDFMGGKTFNGERFNGCHYTVATKRQARERAAESGQ